MATSGTPASTDPEPFERGRAEPGAARRGGVDQRAIERRTMLAGFLFGCGIAASVIDLFIFHLGLQ